MAMNCDPIARWYRYLEYGSFGPALWRCRCNFLDHAVRARRVLMVGEGDGRFLHRFLQLNTNATVDYVDSSAAMTSLARRRIANVSSCNRVTFLTQDLRDCALDTGTYDLIFTHFFLDCFDNTDVAAIVQSIARSAADGALWVVSEFSVSGHGWRRLRSRLWVRFLYAAFHWTTGLERHHLPAYEPALQGCNFNLVHRRPSNAGLLTSELWRKFTPRRAGITCPR
jgi:ubiquinone/menaquinone biosynthesis C-methylase UbiE